jgi:hypothetical protein
MNGNTRVPFRNDSHYAGSGKMEARVQEVPPRVALRRGFLVIACV